MLWLLKLWCYSCDAYRSFRLVGMVGDHDIYKCQVCGSLRKRSVAKPIAKVEDDDE